MFETALAEEITHRQAGMAAADDDSIDLFVHRDLPKRAVNSLDPPETIRPAGSSLATLEISLCSRASSCSVTRRNFSLMRLSVVARGFFLITPTRAIWDLLKEFSPQRQPQKKIRNPNIEIRNKWVANNPKLDENSKPQIRIGFVWKLEIQLFEFVSNFEFRALGLYPSV